MSDPPPPPQVSPDGRFYWDGQKWVPIPQAAPHADSAPSLQPVPVHRFPDQPRAQPAAPNSHRGRNLGIGCLAVIAGIVAIGVVGNNGPKSSTLNWSVSGRQNIATAVGGSDALQVTVTNNGSAAFDLILYLNAKDDRLKHYVITDPGGCSLNTSLERLECGPLAASETRTINVSGTAKDAGNFKFELDVADQEGSQISYPSQGSFTWNAAVTP